MPESNPAQSGEAPTPATFRQRVGAAGFWLVTRCFCWSPRWLAYGIADLLTPLIVFVTKRRERRVAPLGRGLVRNQRIVFRERLDEQKSETHLRAYARHVAYLFVDFCRMPRIHAGNVREFADITALDQVRALFEEGNGVLCASGHMGIWELSGHFAALTGLPITVIARPVKNPALQRVILGIRTCGGQGVLAKWNVLWSINKALVRGELIGIAADENDDTKSTFVPFLGTKAATSVTPALLSKRTGAPIIVVTTNRVGRGRFRMHVWDIIRSTKSRNHDLAELSAITERVNRALCKAVTEYPEQWLWGSRRFMTRPDDEVLDADGLPPRSNRWDGPIATTADRA